MSDTEFYFSFQGPKATPDFPSTLKRSKSFSDILEEAEHEKHESPKRNLFTEKIVRQLKFAKDECFKELTRYFFIFYFSFQSLCFTTSRYTSSTVSNRCLYRNTSNFTSIYYFHN